MEGRSPQERFPLIGTVRNPALFFDGRDLLLCYAVAPAAGGGAVILEFGDVFSFEKNANTAERPDASVHPLRPWHFTEVTGSEATERWKPLPLRLWTISFNDMAVEVVFATVRKVHETRETSEPHRTLLDFLRRHD